MSYKVCKFIQHTSCLSYSNNNEELSTESERYLQTSDFRLRTSHFEVQTSDFGIVIHGIYPSLVLAFSHQTRYLSLSVGSPKLVQLCGSY